MRNLTASLLAAQKETSRVPFVKIEAKNKIAGVVRLDWDRLYTGSEDDYWHSLTIPGDGSLVRARLTPPSGARKLYRQRVADPGPSSDFSGWTYTGQYNCVAVAAASLGAEVSIFWINLSSEIRRIKSTDYGVSWGSPELIGYTSTNAINGMSAAYKPNGDLAMVVADQTRLFIKERVSDTWQEKIIWDKTTGDLSGAAVIYDADWNILVTGQDSAGNFKVWSLIYGDGGDVASGNWSELKELASAPSDGDFEYGSVFMDKPDVCRCFYTEKFRGTDTYNRPFWSHLVAGTKYLDSLWREPVPFNLSSEYGLAMANYADYCWLSTPFGVWRAGLTEESLDLTPDIISLRQEAEQGLGKLDIELRNDNGDYASLPSPLAAGCQIEISPGYVTAAGNEASSGQTFHLESFQHTSLPGRASLFLSALDGWAGIKKWQARQHFRWNKTGEVMNVKQILEFILARAGLKLEVISQSSVITGYYPDFSIHSGVSGDAVISRLLSFVPDVVFIEGNRAYLVNPRSSDGSVYSYGQSHPIYEGRYLKGAWEINRVQVEGYDPVGDNPIVVDSFQWGQINGLYDRLKALEDRNIDTVAGAGERGAAHLRESEIEAAAGDIRIPVNCGQQLYDVIDISDTRAGLSSEKKRVLGIRLVYNPSKGEYDQRLLIGAV